MRYNAGEIITAMITPFKEDLSVDYVALEKLVNHLIDNGTDAILVAGTTGETPTLSHEEEREIFLFHLNIQCHSIFPISAITQIFRFGIQKIFCILR